MNDFISNIQATLKSLPPFKKLVVGLSGGMDSMVLTHALKTLDYELIVCHLNHQLRKEANEEEIFVKKMAKQWKLPCVTKKVSLPKNSNLENAGRQKRYQFFEAERKKNRADFIAVAHHADDQIETILMHQKRGAGLRGVRGMQMVSGHVIRPLLMASRKEIEHYAKIHHIPFVTDPSNFDLSFERNKLRHDIIPELKKDKKFTEKIRQLSLKANEELKTLEKERNKWMTACIKNKTFKRDDFNQLSVSLKAEILIHLLGQQDVYRATLSRLMNFLEKGKAGKELTVKGITFAIEYDQVKWFEKKEAYAPLKKKRVKGYTQWNRYEISIADLPFPIYVRHWKQGDRFQPVGMKGTKKLQDFFTDLKIPKRERSMIPIIVDEKDDIICVGHLRFSEPFKEMKNKIRIEYN